MPNNPASSFAKNLSAEIILQQTPDDIEARIAEREVDHYDSDSARRQTEEARQ